MNENLQKLEVKIENQGSTPQGKVSAAEWNTLVAAVKALDAAGIDTETLAKYLQQYQYITTPELEELLKDVTENLDGVVDLKSAQTIEGLKDFVNGFKIGGALVKYDTAKKCFIFTENVLMEKGLAWNSRFEDFSEEEIFSITKAVDVDWETIGKRADGKLYVIPNGSGGGGNYDPEFLESYLTNNGYVTDDDVTSLLTDYLPKSGGTVDGNVFVGEFGNTSNKYIALTRDSHFLRLNNLSYGGYITFGERTTPNTYIAEKMLRLGDYGLQYSEDGGATFLDVIHSGNYSNYALPITGGTVNGNITATGNVSAQNVIINGKTIIYDSDKDALIFPCNVLFERGVAWNSKIGGFDVPTITDAVSIDGTSIIRDGGVLRVSPDYIQSVGGLDENELHNYLTNNKYITESALSPYAKTENVNSLLTDYVDKTSIKKYMGWSQAHHIGQDIDRLYDFGVVSTAGNINTPSTAAYGVVATFPYRNAYGNSIPDLAAQLYFPNGDEATPHLFWRSSIKNAWNSWRTILDSSNYANYALPITGGTVNGNITATKFIGALEGTASNADKLANLNVSNFARYYDGAYLDASEVPDGVYGGKLYDSPNWEQKYFSYLSVGKGVYKMQFNGRNNLLYYRAGNDDGLSNKPWREVAFTDSNVASATKLATPHTLWGRSFDGTDDISGYLSSVSYIRYNSSSARIYIKGSEYAEGTLTDADIGIKANIAAFSGKVAIGNITATEALHVHGNILATGRIAWNSSRVLKTEIKKHYLSLENLAKIKPYQYKWKDSRDNLVHVGAIADEVIEILPETVLTDSLGIHSMDYAQTAFVMAASLTPHVSDHERRINDLEIENEALKREIEKLKRAA